MFIVLDLKISLRGQNNCYLKKFVGKLIYSVISYWKVVPDINLIEDWLTGFWIDKIFLQLQTILTYIYYVRVYVAVKFS